LAIINFQSTAWIHLKLTDGISDANVNASVQSLGCPVSCDQNNGASCTGNIDACCCCCGTCISCGVRLGADQFPSGRKFAFKLLIVITDGFANTPSAGQTCTPDCNADLRAGTTYAISKVPDPTQIALYAVGVGSDRDVSAEQLLIVANGRQDHVLRRNSFSELASVNVELISRSCDQNFSLVEDAVVSAHVENANPQILARTKPHVTWDTSETDKFAVPLNQRTAQLKLLLTSVLPSFAKTELASPTPPFNVELLKTPLASTVLAYLPLDCARPLKPEYALLN